MKASIKKSLRGVLATLCTALCFMVLMGTTVFAQDPAQYGTPFAGVPDPRDVNIYQVNAREYDASNRKLAGVTAKLDNIQALGVNVIYLMPIYPIGVTKASGSPYSISDLKGIASDLGTLTDLRALVDGAHSRGMAVILDWVANQTSWDHPWLTQHKDWYKQDASGIVLSPTPDGSFFFTDCAALNFSNTAMRAAMVDAMRYWIFAANVDGFRCDWADNPPQDFWTNTISNLRGITSHKILMLAEGSNEGTSTGCTTCGQNQPGAHYAEGFDFIFGESFYWNFMKKVYNSGESAATDLAGVTNGEYTGAGASQLVARYLSNHDEYGTDGSPFSWLSGGRNAVMSAFVVGAYYRGVPFIYNGIEVGNTSALTYPWNAQSINWTQDPTVLTEMKKLLNFRNVSTAVRRGTPTSYSTADVVAFTKINGTEKVVAMINTRNASKTFTIPAAMAGTYNDAFTNASVTLTSGATQTLNAFQYIILSNASVPVVPVTGVTVLPTSASVKSGLTTQLSATVAPSNASNQSVTWTSSNTAVATVNSTGLVTGVAAGTATITVKTVDGNKTATSAITVTPSSNFTVHFFRPSTWGTAIKIYWWAAQPAGTLADGTWPGVAMTNEGSSTWYSYTFTNITSTNLIFNDGTNQTADLNRAGTNGWYYNGAWYNSQPTTVPVTGVTVSPTSATVSTTQQLTATVAPANATNQTVSWTSSNTAVATVNGTGLVTAVSGGTATITVTTQDGNKTATCAVTVPASGGTYYVIKNRWKGTYLYDAGANVGYGTTIANNNYKWQKVTIDATYFWLKNLGTGEYMNIEAQNGSVQCGVGDINWWSQQWSQDNVDGTYVRFRNRWQTGSIIHVENQTGFAQYAGGQDGWFSAQWQLVATTGRISTHNEEAIESEDAPVSVDIFPNPVSGRYLNVAVFGLKNQEVAVTIHDLTGKVALETKVTQSQRIEHNLKTGLYIVRVRANGYNATKKFAVE
jgi:uncharacterized protein YjdB